ncbi:MAG: Na+ dependent nucleoside transporter [Flavobacteriaceae bacterium]|nr:Na+ dependent nucleoside transporter [Flavobacteriaceae bacterium]|tara:strand:+ start:3712 stop:5097 length:1386 start_codon:yes stop_codon:yes gene_type:complete
MLLILIHYLSFGFENIIYNQQNFDIVTSQGFSLESFIRGFFGIVVLIFISFLFSKNKKAVKWKTVFIGLGLQLILAVAVLKISFVKNIFETAGKVFVKILDFTMQGTAFLFGDLVSADNFGNVFVFSILPTVIFFAALTSILFYFGIIQKVVKIMALLLSKLLGVSGPESLSVAGNIFLGQTESPLMIKAYLEKMSKSEILLVMIGGMATVAGGVLAAYIGFLGGDDPEMRVFYAKHLLTASVMAAPGAIVISKILIPETEKVNDNFEVSKDKIGTNFLEAISNGTSEGLKLAANIGAMLLVFLAFIAMINYFLNGVGDLFQINQFISENTVYQKLSLELILGFLFSPLMWLIGVAKEDITLMGQLLGIKLAASEFIGYIQLSTLKDVSSEVHLNYQKSIVMATYMLCGFANFASIGIQIGGIGALEPKQKKNLSKLGFLAVLGGTIASLLSATIAGMIIG